MSQELVKTPQKNGGPYTKAERDKRRKEVYRLHMELGLPASRISQLMHINRATITADLKFLYRQIRQDTKDQHYFENAFAKQMLRLEGQRARLMEYLEKTPDVEKKVTIERTIAEIDFKILTSIEKSENTRLQFLCEVMEDVNESAKKLGLTDRFFTLETILRLPPEDYEKAWKIIKKGVRL